MTGSDASGGDICGRVMGEGGFHHSSENIPAGGRRDRRACGCFCAGRGHHRPIFRRIRPTVLLIGLFIDFSAASRSAMNSGESAGAVAFGVFSPGM